MDNWEEIKTAYHVATLGTVSEAAEVLNVHRATVIRHINSLEEAIGQKLFVRTSYGYTPTELGQDLFRVAKITDEQFKLLKNRFSGYTQKLSGELIIASPDFISPIITPVITKFHNKNQNVKTSYIITNKLLKLEYGEAHVAIRVGEEVHNIDNYINQFYTYKVGMYASPKYIDRYGLPKSHKDFSKHYFVERKHSIGAPFENWLQERVPNENFIFRTSSPLVGHLAISDGIGIGFFPEYKLKEYPDLVEIIPRIDSWDVPLWVLTHVDMHKTEKVQTFLNVMSEHFPNYKRSQY